MIIFQTFSAAVLLSSPATSQKAPPARKLVVYPGYNEIEATSSFKNELRTLLGRLSNIRRKISEVKLDVLKNADNVRQKLSGQKEKTSMDLALNKLFIQTQKDIQTAKFDS